MILELPTLTNNYKEIDTYEFFVLYLWPLNQGVTACILLSVELFLNVYTDTIIDVLIFYVEKQSFKDFDFWLPSFVTYRWIQNLKMRVNAICEWKFNLESCIIYLLYYITLCVQFPFCIRYIHWISIYINYVE